MLQSWWFSLPTVVRLFLRDAIEGVCATAFALTVAVPRTLDEARASALIIAIALTAPVLAAGRRYLSEWVVSKINAALPVPEDPTTPAG